MVRAGLLVATAVVAASLVGAASRAVAQTLSPQLALVVTYADGRVTESFVGPNGRRAWTPYFPRIEGWRDPAGVLPVTALDLHASAQGERIRVEVSVLRGPTRDVEDAITTVMVHATTPVVVTELLRVGLRPITLSVKPFATPALHVPRGDSRVAGLVIDGIEPVAEPAPAYRITIRNTTDVAAVTVAFDAYSGGRPALSGQQGEPAALPIVTPGETFTFRLSLTGGRDTGRSFATATPIDDVILTGVIWADGRTAGAAQRVAPLLALHRGRLATLTSVTAAIRAAATRRDVDPISGLRVVRDAIAELPSTADQVSVATVLRLMPELAPPDREGIGPAMSMGSQDVRRRLVDDLDRLMPTMTPQRARQWLDEALPACEEWFARLHAMFPPR